jgi:hypothetical protein
MVHGPHGQVAAGNYFVILIITSGGGPVHPKLVQDMATVDDDQYVTLIRFIFLPGAT